MTQIVMFYADNNFWDYSLMKLLIFQKSFDLELKSVISLNGFEVRFLTES